MSAVKKDGSSSHSLDDLKRMSEDLKDKIRAAWPIDEAISALTGATLKSKGMNGTLKEACCPFHVERSPSFQVNTVSGRYHCFGSGCGASGDIFELIKTVEGCDFHSAVLSAAERLGIEVPPPLRKSSGTKKAKPATARKIHAYPKNEVKQVPANMHPDTFLAVPPTVRKPVAGKQFRIWDDGGWDGAREKRERFFIPEMVHTYRNAEGEILMCILRVKGRDGKKYFFQIRLEVPSKSCPTGFMESWDAGSGRVAWVLAGARPGTLMPIYGLEDAPDWQMHDGHTVLVVEGEKTRDAMRRLVRSTDEGENILVISPMGGGSSSIYADWAPMLERLRGREGRIVIWPDADKPIERPDGTFVDRVDQYVLQTFTAIVQRAIDLGLDMTRISLEAVIPPSGVDSGWDVADAEAEGWSGDRILRFMERNSRNINMSSLALRTTQEEASATSVSEPEAADVMVQTEDPAQNALQALWDDLASEELAPVAEIISLEAGQTMDASSDHIGEEFAETAKLAEVVDIDGNDGDDDIEEDPVRENPYFRCLGYSEGINFYQCKRSGQIYSYAPKSMKKEALLAIAPLEWWLMVFPRRETRGGGGGFDLDMAVDALIRTSYDAGVWEPSKEVSQGGRIDRGRVVFNTGQKLYVEGIGMMDLDAYKGDYCYTVGPRSRTPNFDNPFPANDPDLKSYVRIVSELDWREDTRELAIMAIVGWVAIGPICGILKQRPHLWLDGPYGSGKTWLITNLIKPVLHDYALSVVANSSESGIRNMLAKKSIPVIFDEAEGEDKLSRERMDGVLRMARHSAVASDSVVAQGTSGGGAHRTYSVASTFLMTSITAQLEAAADASRFAHIHLHQGRKYANFEQELAIPAMKLVTPEFASRFVARMVMRAGDYSKTYHHMVHALSKMNLERRLADVFGTFATGCWLLLRDGVPADEVEAAEFMGDEFHVIEQITQRNTEITNMKDHHKLFRALMGAELTLESRNGGVRREKIGPLIEIAAGYLPTDDVMISEDEARGALNRIGIRVSVEEDACPPGQIATHVLIHKNATAIQTLLEKTPWVRSYADVMLQAEDVKSGKPVRFSAAVGVARTIIVPLSQFSIGANE